MFILFAFPHNTKLPVIFEVKNSERTPYNFPMGIVLRRRQYQTTVFERGHTTRFSDNVHFVFLLLTTTCFLCIHVEHVGCRCCNNGLFDLSNVEFNII